MRIIKFKVYVQTDRVGSKVSDILNAEIDDDATSKDIKDVMDEVAHAWMNENIEWGYDLISDDRTV